ncbi:MAG: DNA-binding protein [Clostridia bacterium]|nr:DNA-binding protein [Clostridia bacterium]
MANNVEITMLFDIYGEMLTEKQRDFLNYYYNDDLSLSEIAENEGITRQGVRDAIKRAETQLYDMEARLGFARKNEETAQRMNDIIACAEKINEYNLEHDLSREINETTVRIKSLALSVIE